MHLPVPTLDHVVINARDRLDGMAGLYQRLGFTLTPRGHHTLGSTNNLAMFGTDYLELLGVEHSAGSRTDVLDWPAGLNGLVFKTFSSDDAYATLKDAGVPVLPPQAFSRPVDMPGGPRDAAFRTVRLEREAVPVGRVFFCQHMTPELVWHDAWRRHANGVVGIEGLVIAAADPSELLELFARMFGADAIQAGRLVAGLARVEVVTPADLRAQFGAAAPNRDERQFMAALMLRTLSLDRTAAALAEGGINGVRSEAGITVAAEDAGGVMLVFRE